MPGPMAPPGHRQEHALGCREGQRCLGEKMTLTILCPRSRGRNRVKRGCMAAWLHGPPPPGQHLTTRTHSHACRDSKRQTEREMKAKRAEEAEHRRAPGFRDTGKEGRRWRCHRATPASTVFQSDRNGTFSLAAAQGDCDERLSVRFSMAVLWWPWSDQDANPSRRAGRAGRIICASLKSCRWRPDGGVNG
ncbi:hypothetical protein AOQ84DRAFT_365008 [Glonium stellatum]|uniref:Uncharacterized protein n=1 Tax=Glonium stellatum TaxID=574774 RepID=A0A8E2EZW1_9PEZI|nr:hypothetical protein AOQ84DRAFT_365008 [Glonium stellatum]